MGLFAVCGQRTSDNIYANFRRSPMDIIILPSTKHVPQSSEFYFRLVRPSCRTFRNKLRTTALLNSTECFMGKSCTL